jgi:hypothetical protein
MKPTKLRIGNYVFDHENEVKKVAYVSEERGSVIGLDMEWDGATQKYQENPIWSGDINDLSPIPLTEQWLKDFGFEKYENDGWAKMGLKLANLVIYPIGKRSYHEPKNGLLIQHVHQLQNLYFALTGKELVRK